MIAVRQRIKLIARHTILSEEEYHVHIPKKLRKGKTLIELQDIRIGMAHGDLSIREKLNG